MCVMWVDVCVCEIAWDGRKGSTVASKYLVPLSGIMINRHASHECTDDHDDLNALRSICHSFKQQAASRNADTNH